jgi:hypothetical protein
MDEQTTGLTNTSPNAKRAEPKQQAQFDLLLGRARQMLAETGEELIATLQKEPVDGAVTLGTTTLRELVMMSEKSGQPVDPVVLIHTGVQLCKDIAAIANTAGLVSDEDLPQYLKDTMSQSMMAYLEMDREEGLLSPEEKQRAEDMLGQAGPGMQQAMGPKAGAEPPMEPDAGMLAKMQRGGPR